MNLSSLTALSPVDGRYAARTADLRPFLSEFGLIKYRLHLEIEWLIFLAQHLPEIGHLSAQQQKFLTSIHDNFSEADAKEIKKIERTTNHDLKAVEYFLKQKIATHPDLQQIQEFIHFACTSEDINNLAYAMMLNDARHQVILPQLTQFMTELTRMAHQFSDQPLLARTHGQPASPTTVGKELANFVHRLHSQISEFKNVKITGKINGAVGNFNAHIVAYPEVNWLMLSKQFVEKLNLSANLYTTQIEPHDYIANYSQALARINTILIDFSQDMWGYISRNCFIQRAVEHEVGSSTMPHKVNPIDFENAEGNLSVANALFNFFASRLPISRFQRDLVDSTILRNLGVALGHCLIAYSSLVKGLSKVAINAEVLNEELDQHWEVLTEAVQTVMRRYKIDNPYEQLKALSRGKKITKDILHAFIDQSDLPDTVKLQLQQLTPANYLGLAAKLAKIS